MFPIVPRPIIPCANMCNVHVCPIIPRPRPDRLDFWCWRYPVDTIHPVAAQACWTHCKQTNKERRGDRKGCILPSSCQLLLFPTETGGVKGESTTPKGMAYLTPKRGFKVPAKYFYLVLFRKFSTPLRRGQNLFMGFVCLFRCYEQKHLNRLL